MNDLVKQLNELKKSREDGSLTEEEFQLAKQKLLRDQQAPNPQAQAYPGRKDTAVKPPEAGDRIGPEDQLFELIQKLGSGGQGDVWLARDLNASQRQGRDILRALKLLPPELYSRPDYQKLLEREADLACELAHPHIINVFGLRPYRLGRHEQPMLIMEYLQGEDLRSKILAANGRPLEWDQLMTWFSQAVDALKYAWESHRIIHRDLKPENLFITQTGDLKLLDFGLAWQVRHSLSKLSKEAAQSQGTGTIEYLPPEAFFGGTKPNPQHDVYALACVLYEALTGDPPFSPELARSRRPEQMPPCPEGLDAGRWKVLKQGLAFSPDDRPANAWEWLHALKKTARSPHEAQRNAGKEDDPKSPDSAKGSIRATADDDNGGSSFAWGKAMAGLVVVMGLGGAWQQGWIGGGEAPVSPPDTETTGSPHEEQRNAGQKEAPNVPDSAKGSIQATKTADQGNEPDTQTPEPAAAKAPESPPPPERLPYEPEMVKIPGGRFQMGCVSGKDCSSDEKPVHWVEIKSFELGKYEVTFVQWDACVADGGCSHEPYDHGWGRGNRPVINVSWDDIQEYIKWLNQKTGKEYRLPSESEWEYAVRAGSKSKYYFGDSESELCRYGNGADKSTDYSWKNESCSDGYAKTAPVGSFKPNRWGLYDTIGNVSEWVQDCWNSSYKGAPTDGSAWESGECERRLLHGGSWFSFPRVLRSANRGRYNAGFRKSSSFGFRLARTVTP